MKAIVAVDMDWAIGNEGNLLFKIPRDMKHFKRCTEGKIVLMGRKTFDSMSRVPLPNRTNLILTNSDMPITVNPNCCIGNEKFIDELLKRFGTRDVFIIGGESIYKHYLDKCDELIITKYYKWFINKDAYFPKPFMNNFEISEVIAEREYEGYTYSIERWTRKDFPYTMTGSIKLSSGRKIDFVSDDLKSFYDARYCNRRQLLMEDVVEYVNAISNPYDSSSGNWYIEKIQDDLYRCQYRMKSCYEADVTLETYTKTHSDAKSNNIRIFYKLLNMYNSK